jgi:hypothetical protein
MHDLPLVFTQNQWAYVQVERTGDYAIYAQRRKDLKSTRFEVIHVRLFEERQSPTGVIEAGEYYPGASQWGTHGWTHFTLGEAQAHLQTLLTSPPSTEDQP